MLIACARLPDDKAAWARILSEQVLGGKVPRLLYVKTLNQIRCIMERSKSANAIRTYLAAPVDTLMRFGDEKRDWAVCTNKEIWGDFRRTAEVLENHLQAESARRNLLE